MRIETHIELNRTARTFLICAIALAFPFWSAGFELGAYGELFYIRKITAWSTVTAALVALLLIPRKAAPVSPLQLLILAVPSIWLLVAAAIGAQSGGEVLRPVLFVLGTASYLFCLPYAVYLIVQIINPEILSLEGWGPKVRLVALAVVFVAVGFGVGARNDLFMTCQDFEVAGDTPPANCRPANP